MRVSLTDKSYIFEMKPIIVESDDVNIESFSTCQFCHGDVTRQFCSMSACACFVEACHLVLSFFMLMNFGVILHHVLQTYVKILLVPASCGKFADLWI